MSAAIAHEINQPSPHPHLHGEHQNLRQARRPPQVSGTSI